MGKSSLGNPYHDENGRFCSANKAKTKVFTPQEEFEIRNFERETLSDKELSDYIDNNTPQFEGEETSPKVRSAMYKVNGEIEIGNEADTYTEDNVYKDKKGKYIELGNNSAVGREYADKVAEFETDDGDQEVKNVTTKMRVRNGALYVQVSVDKIVGDGQNRERTTVDYDYEYEGSYAEERFVKKLLKDAS